MRYVAKKFVSFKKLAVVCFCILASIHSAASVGGCKLCETYVPKRVCFVSTKMGPMTPLARMSGAEACGEGAEIFQVDTGQDIRDYLEKLAQNCVQLTHVNFFSHGNNVEIRNMVKSEEWPSFNSYSCLLKEAAVIDTRACNIGRGCDGALQMYRIANALFGGKSGSVLSPTFFTFAISSRPTSLFQVPDRLLKYNSNEHNKILTFLSDTNPSQDLSAEVQQQCGEEIEMISYVVKEILNSLQTVECESTNEKILSRMNELSSTLKNRELNKFFEQVENLRSLGFTTFSRMREMLKNNPTCL